MKKFKFLLLTSLLTASTMLSTSCSKVQGCTDPDATNFSTTAEENDGSCTFESRVVFWYNEVTAQNLILDGSDALTFYVNNNIVGSNSTSIYWTGAPNCGDNASITVTTDLGGNKTQSYSYSVIDDLGDEVWSGVINFNANTCKSIELVW